MTNSSTRRCAAAVHRSGSMSRRAAWTSSRRVSSASTFGRKYSSPLRSDSGPLRRPERSIRVNAPSSIHVSRTSSTAPPLTIALASRHPLSPPALAPAMTSVRRTLPVSPRSPRYTATASSSRPIASSPALRARSISATTPPIQMARLPPPLRTSANRISRRAVLVPSATRTTLADLPGPRQGRPLDRVSVSYRIAVSGNTAPRANRSRRYGVRSKPGSSPSSSSATMRPTAGACMKP